MKPFLLSFLLALLFITKTIYGQTEPPDPCTDGTQNTCTCSSSPVLCTIDDLDGYQYSMTDFIHEEDGPHCDFCFFDPSFMCPGSGATTSHNPTWFAFPAWCEDLDLEVVWDNCQQNSGFCNSLGIQAAVYSECFGCGDCFGPSWEQTSETPAPYTYSVDCDVDGCGPASGSAELNLTGLEIGKLYYFMVDGCCGSYCDITINVLGTCGVPDIDDWTNPIDGPEVVCLGDPATYFIDRLDGANLYHWYIDGVESFTTIGSGSEINWTEEGTFELCVDASNDPCIPVTSNPDQICMTVQVFDPSIGDLIVDPNPICPGEVANISVIDANDNPDLDLAIIVTNRDGIVEQVDLADATTFTYPDCETFLAYAYQYIPSEVTLPSVGDNFDVPDCSNSCCEILLQEFSFEDDEAPTFLDPPPNESYTCINAVPDMEDLEFDDNCIDVGFTEGVEDGAQDVCDGGSITRTWIVEDSCGNVAEHVQTITVDPLPEADWVDPPANETVDCNSIPMSYPDLEYTNGAPNPECEISGTVSPDVVEDIVDCEGTIIVTWTFSDNCDRTIEHVQTITVDPPAIPDWVDPPANETVSCAMAPDGSAPFLQYTNGQTDDCEISGEVEATVMGSADECGGSYTYEWTFTDDCNRTITHSQEVTVEPATTPDWVDPPANENLTCNDLPLPTPPDLEYTNGETGDCEISGFVSPTVDGSVDLCGGSVTYSWDFTDGCGNSISHTQTITVDPVPEPDWVDPPANENLTCNDLPLPTPPDLEYTNGETGDCEISGAVSPAVDGSVDLCGGSVTYNWDFTDACGNSISHTQTITVEPVPEPDWVDPPTNEVLACDALPLPSPPDLEYSNGESGDCEVSGMVSPTVDGMADECGGTITYTWSAMGDCGTQLEHTQVIEIEPAPAATFIDPPANVVLSCDDLPLPPPPELSYSNGESGVCEIAGSVAPTVDGEADACGGTLTYTWMFTDNCDREITHVQTLEVEPAAEPAWVDPPSGITLDCSEAADYDIPDLEYTNGASGDCEIAGFVEGVQIGTINPCGGTISFEWTYTDDCDRTITHSQTVNVTPASPPAFTDVPDDIEVTCNEAVGLSPPTLSYDNGEGGDCSLSGSVDGTTSGSFTACGGNLVQNWSFTDACGRSISASRNVTVLPAAAPDWDNLPGNITVTCSE